ncbi:RDD family protein [Gracilibacillus caseinilyticus]|uniref:RDD family protein n=1 Tax=Gracilibacillus caseinilyticus TaxID=2932256 RepID=A0ABY4EZY3_9BACI|nr:RDD family protein [Gracilibacillus caseinilyticus]UOQ49214.1 RDD family protein [Gracilibacillus caseinilyticus]
MEQEQLNVKTPEYVTLQFHLAGLGSRGASQIIDYLLIFLVQFAIILILTFSLENNPSGILLINEYDNVILAVGLVIIFALNFGYFIFLEYFWGGRTIGKKLVGIRVIQENGHNVTFLSSLIRNLLRIIDMLPGFYAAGILFVFFHSKHKRLGDLAAGTLVVHERRDKTAKRNALDKYIDHLALDLDELPLTAQQLKQFNQKEWRLIQTYAHRIAEIRPEQKQVVTKQVSDIVLSRLEESNYQNKDKERVLLLLYLYLKEEWEL